MGGAYGAKEVQRPVLYAALGIAGAALIIGAAIGLGKAKKKKSNSV